MNITLDCYRLVTLRDYVFIKSGDFLYQIGLRRENEQEETWKKTINAYKELGISLTKYDKRD